MLFQNLRKDNQDVSKDQDLWILGEILRSECNSSSLDLYRHGIYLDGIDGSRNSIYISIETYETDCKVRDLEDNILHFNGISITFKYHDKKIYDAYSHKLQQRLLRLNFRNFGNIDEVPFGFEEAKIIHCLSDKQKISTIKVKPGFKRYTRLKILCDDID